jgi:methylenetetrahydrofolate dehydrogenase (NADP+) / methenyltetrahydrofolate cyclohydrolase
MTQLLKAKPLVESIISKLTDKTAVLTYKLGRKPKMVVVLVGDNPASLSYIRNKRKKCEQVGAEFELLQLEHSTSEETFVQTINKLNDSDDVDGFIIQMPVPEQLKHLELMNMVNPSKDIDGFHIQNIFHLYANDHKKALLPCTPKGIVKLCEFYNIKLEGKSVCIIGRSLIVGKPLLHLMSSKNATVTLCHSKTKNIKDITKRCDIIVTALGSPKFLDRTFLNDTKTQVLIDVGINSYNGKLCGDCDFENIKGHVAAITPVPGGVGPMTVISLISNLLSATSKKVKI